MLLILLLGLSFSFFLLLIAIIMPLQTASDSEAAEHDVNPSSE